MRSRDGLKKVRRIIGESTRVYECPNCMHYKHWHEVQVSTYRFVMGVPLFLVERKYVIACPVCRSYMHSQKQVNRPQKQIKFVGR